MGVFKRVLEKLGAFQLGGRGQPYDDAMPSSFSWLKEIDIGAHKWGIVCVWIILGRWLCPTGAVYEQWVKFFKSAIDRILNFL